MAYALVVHWGGFLGTSGGTSDAIDTTGADLLVVAVHENGYAGGTVPTDSEGNTWHALTLSRMNYDSSQVTFFYADNAVVGATHTFSYVRDNAYPSMSIQAFSGSLTASTPVDQENGATGFGDAAQNTGSVTPSENNELIVAAICMNGAFTDLAIDLGFAIQDEFGTSSYTGGSAYLIQTDLGAVNPEFTWTTTRNAAAAIATFKAAAAAGISVGVQSRSGIHGMLRGLSRGVACLLFLLL